MSGYGINYQNAKIANMTPSKIKKSFEEMKIGMS